MPIKSNCCDSPIAAKCMKCEKMCEVIEYQTSSWSAHYGFPYYITIGHLWWKKRVPNGWEDRGKVGTFLDKRNYYTSTLKHDFCRTQLHVGIENLENFKFCPVCMVKITDELITKI